MPPVKMCSVCRGSKQKCAPAERIWIPGERQDRCERCTQLNHDCGPHEYPPARPRARRGAGGRASQSSSSSSRSLVLATPGSLPQQLEAPNDLQEIKQELWRRLSALEIQVEATKKLKVALDYFLPDGQPSDTIAELFSSWTANVRILALMPAQAEGLADRLAGCGEIEVAEAAYNRILDVYRGFRTMDIKAWHENKSLLRKFADMQWNNGEPIRAENLVWEALSLRDVPETLPSDLEFLKSLARSLPKTCLDISKSIHSTFDGAIPPHLLTPVPPLQSMMQSVFASSVSGSPFHIGEFPETSRTQNASPIPGGMETVMDFLRTLPVEALETRDIYEQSPIYMASWRRMEGLGRGILRRLAEVSRQRVQNHLNTRDRNGQTVLGASILGGCSVQYVKFLIEAGAIVDPDPVMKEAFTPLQAAAMSGSSDVVRLLLDNGAEIGRVYPGNPTPLVLAEAAGHADVVQQLSNATIGHSSSPFNLGWSPG